MDNSGDRDQLIPVRSVDTESTSLASPMLRGNPMIWEGAAQAEGVFVGLPNDAEPLAILSSAPVSLPVVPRLPQDFKASQALRDWLLRLRRALQSKITGTSTASDRLAADAEWVEVGGVPDAVTVAARSLEPAPFAVPAGTDDASIAAWGPMVINAPAVLHEVSDRAAAYAAPPSADGYFNHVTNFARLPMSNPIRDTLEIGGVPQPICAQRSDFEDAVERLDDLLEAYLQ